MWGRFLVIIWQQRSMVTMNSRLVELINLLELDPHVGGGYIREIFRSTNFIHLPGNQEERSALTTTYYLLRAGEYDCWHRLEGNEVWHYHEGATLELFWIEQGGDKYTHRLVGEIGELSRPIAVVPGGCWQMSRTTGEYTLMGCTMGPGFEYEDYQLLRDYPEEASEIQRRFPELAEFL
jgi:predicted cupin superfamily sugar epimerase